MCGITLGINRSDIDLLIELYQHLDVVAQLTVVSWPAALSAGVYSCCGRPAHRGPSQRPSPHSGCVYQPHTPLTPPSAPIYPLNSDSALSSAPLAVSELAESPSRRADPVQTLLKYQNLIVRQPEDIQQEHDHARRARQEEEDKAQLDTLQQVCCRKACLQDKQFQLLKCIKRIMHVVSRKLNSVCVLI